MRGHGCRILEKIGPKNGSFSQVLGGEVWIQDEKRAREGGGGSNIQGNK